MAETTGHWRIEVDTEYTGLDVDGLERFAEAFERGFGHMAPVAALHDGQLAFTVIVVADTIERAIQEALAAANATLLEVGVPADEDVVVTHVNMDSQRELAIA